MSEVDTVDYTNVSVILIKFLYVETNIFVEVNIFHVEKCEFGNVYRLFLAL